MHGMSCRKSKQKFHKLFRPRPFSRRSSRLSHEDHMTSRLPGEALWDCMKMYMVMKLKEHVFHVYKHGGVGEITTELSVHGVM